MTTRPAFTLLAARLAPAGVATIGQEHMHLGAHRPALAADVRRRYGALDALAVLTAEDARAYERVLDGATPVVAIPNAVPPQPGGPSPLRDRVVVAAGRLNGQKGFDRLLRAWAPVGRAHPDWQLRIYGAGPQRAALERLLLDLGLTGSAVLMGATRDLAGALERASAFALSSRFEGLPMVMLEAMGKGLPVVAFDCPTGPGEVLTDGRDGRLVPDGDLAALGAALEEVIADPQRRRALGEGALRTAGAYAPAVVTRRWEALVEEVGARRGSPGGSGYAPPPP
jgi:glycosyltransferase involved in cell wall biosynthesis